MRDSMGVDNLPDDLPVPCDDGGADHLVGRSMPSLALPATIGGKVNLAEPGRAVYFIYPMTGRPGQALPQGWDDIPGARGCTPQSCHFRDLYEDFRALGYAVFGVSAQSSEWQREASHRLHLPYALLSDELLALQSELALPTFTVEGAQLYKRLTLIVHRSTIVQCFYPVFPPDRNAADVLHWLRDNGR
ncbi:MAG: peroxiredoxin [Pseudomonadota bacterium]